MIIILALFLKTVFAQQEKYIELIPEERKQELLEKVGTRIIESVESNVTNIHNRELIEKQLNAYNSNVQNLFKQEAEAFQVQKHQRHENISEDRDKINNLDKSTLDLETVESTTKIQDIKIKNTTNTLSSIFKYPKATNFIQEVDNLPTETTTVNKRQILEYNTAKTSEIISLATKRNNNKKYIVKEFESGSNGTESYRDDSSVGTLNSSLVDESTTVSVIDTTTYKNAELPTTLSSQTFTTLSKNTAEVNIATTENNAVVTEDRSKKELLPTVTEIDTFTRTLTTIYIKEKQKSKKTMKKKLKTNVKQPESDRFKKYVTSRALKKQELQLKKQGKFIDNDIETTNKGNTNLNYYRVYEIPWPTKRNKQPFHRIQEPIKDQTYLVPVYKYSPKFAYYNPQNRLGPNELKENAIELDKQLREGNSDMLYKAEPSEFVLQLNNELRKFGKFKRKSTTTTELPFPTETVLEEVKKIDKELEKRKQIFQILINFSLKFIKDFIKPYTNPYESKENDESRDKESSGCKTSKEEWNESQNKGRIINKRLKTTDKQDYYSILKKLQSFNYPLIRSKADSKDNINLKVLKDLILNDSKGLKRYDDQLSTSKKVLTALSEISKLIKRMRQSEQLYPADFKLLRYMVFLHNLSLKEKKENKKLGYKLKKKVHLAPKNTFLKSGTDISTNVNSHVFTTMSQNTDEVKTATTENYSAVTQDLSAKKHLDVIKKTKHELKLKKKEKLIDNEIETTSKGNTHVNNYQVLDIPWPFKRNNQPFFRSQEPINGQPYYVPIYKYTPNFAYYNPKNHLGPNEVEENSIGLDTNLREGNSKIHDKNILQKLIKNRQKKRSTATLAPRNIPYPGDLQKLRYMVFLHNLYLEAKKENIKLSSKLRKRVKFLTKIVKLLKEKGLISRAWPYLRTPQSDLTEYDVLSYLYEQLIDAQDRMFNLQEAFKHIVDMTKFDCQNWYGNLKQLYLSADEKHLRELLPMSRLIDLIEHSCKHLLDHDFIQFVETNKKDAKRIVEEMIFINDIVHDITINKG